MSRRCSQCGINWPNFLEHSTCAKCGGKTDLIGNQPPMSLAEASSLKRELEFARYYDEREAAREGPSPEQKGREEAATIIALDRQVEQTLTKCGRCGEEKARPIVTEWREPVCPDCWRDLNGDAA
jgi:hypothetical protein